MFPLVITTCEAPRLILHNDHQPLLIFRLCIYKCALIRSIPTIHKQSPRAVDKTKKKNHKKSSKYTLDPPISRKNLHINLCLSLPT